MHIVADRVFPDEPAFGLMESPRLRSLADGSRALRWVQQVFVIRSDAIAKYETDFGPAEDFQDVTPLFMPSLGDDTVAQLQEHADKNREDDFWTRRATELLAGSTLIQDAIRFCEVRRQNMLNRSVVGPAITVQRNGLSRDRTERQYKETRDAKRGFTTF